MKILVIMKRFGANKDMVMQNFGRQIRLFELLAKKHKIDFFCPDYKKGDSKIVERKGIRFIIKPIGPFSTIKSISYLNKLIKKEKYDIIVATTDPIIGILGYYYSKKYRIPLVYDLQDNFEVYSSYKIPFIRYFDKKVIKNAEVVLSVSNTLKKYISSFRNKSIYVIQNGVDLNLFKDINKTKARKKLNLPLKSKIITYIGNIDKFRGGEILNDSFNDVKKKYPDVYLLLSGKVDKSLDMKQKNIIFKEFPKREDVVLGINASDVAILPNPLNNFTRHGFPYKIAEYMACNVPIVATDVGDVSLLLKKYRGSLCKPNNSDDLSKKIISKLKKNKKVDYGNDLKNLSWDVLASKLDKIMENIKTK